jgi:hypothetical protein
MLEANKSLWFEKIFSIYNRNLLKRRFQTLRFSGLEILDQDFSEVPRIIYVNHSSWWDGLVALQISRTLQLDSFVMMEEKHLKRLYLFRRLGAFSVVRENPFEAIKSINYAVSLLQEKPKRTLWIFPQGEIHHNDIRPIEFFNGFSSIIKKIEKCVVFPFAFRYEFLGDFKPEIFTKVGRAEVINLTKNFNVKNVTRDFENKMTVLLDEVRSDILNKNFNEYQNII